MRIAHVLKKGPAYGYDTTPPPPPEEAAWVQVALRAMKADAIPVGTSGGWRVHRESNPYKFVCTETGPGPFTFLLHDHSFPAAQTVMSDDYNELRKHLEAVHRARGRMLITGLGLGCVLRGALTRPVQHVDVVERDSDVLRLVADHLPADPRIHLHEADAVEWVRSQVQRGTTWDLAWHDLWINPDTDQERHLPSLHADLLIALRKSVGWQWAWAMPRPYRRIARARGLAV